MFVVGKVFDWRRVRSRRGFQALTKLAPERGQRNSAQAKRLMAVLKQSRRAGRSWGVAVPLAILVLVNLRVGSGSRCVMEMSMRRRLPTVLHPAMQHRTQADHASARQAQGQVAPEELLQSFHRDGDFIKTCMCSWTQSTGRTKPRLTCSLHTPKVEVRMPSLTGNFLLHPPKPPCRIAAFTL